MLTIIDDGFSELRDHVIFFVKALIEIASWFQKGLDILVPRKYQFKAVFISITESKGIDGLFVNFVDEILRSQFSYR